MATYTDKLIVLQTNGSFAVPNNTDNIKQTNFTVSGTLDGSGATVDFTGSAMDFTGATITGLVVPAGANITDGTGSLGFLGAAGAVSATGVTTITLAGGNNSAVSYTSTGTGTFAARSATGTATYGDGTGTMVFSGAGAISYSGLTTYALTASGAISYNSTGGAISLGNNADNQAINLGTGGTRTLTFGSANATINWNTSGGASTLTINNNSATAFRVYDGTTALLTVNTVSDAVSLQAKLTQGQGTNSTPQYQGWEAVAGEALAVGDVVCIANDAGTPKIYKADATTSTNKYLAVGVCGRAAAANGDPTLVSFGLTSATFGSAPAAADNGIKYVYLSETAGQATVTAPTTSGSSVIRLGVLYGANGADTLVRIAWQAAFVGDNL